MGRNTLVASGIYQGKKVEQVSDVFVKIQPRHIAAANIRQLELAVNVGSNCFFMDDKSDLCWLPDQVYTPGSWGYVGGEVFYRSPGRIGTTAEVKNTRNVPLLQTKRKDIKAYRFDLSDGEYEVELLFADLNAPSERVTYDWGYCCPQQCRFPGQCFQCFCQRSTLAEPFFSSDGSRWKPLPIQEIACYRNRWKPYGGF